jgi:hypothetical protein
MPAKFELVLPVVFTAASCCLGQWSAVQLYSDYSEVRAINSSWQAGLRQGMPGYWSGSASAWTPLAPAGATGGSVSGIDGSNLVGTYHIAEQQSRAALWPGTSAGRVDLHPPSAFTSGAYDVRGGVQVGFTGNGQTFHAAVWNGTAGSHVDLHPPDWAGSFANATHGAAQGGTVYMSSPSSPRAALWTGSAGSFVNLHPPGTQSSQITEMASGVQVGWAFSLQGQRMAGTWNGSAETWRSLHPSGSFSHSQFWGTTGSIHAGELTALGGYTHAAINWGSPDAWLDLHQFLPTGYTGHSRATSIHVDGSTVYVGGWAGGTPGGYHAFMWVGTIPTPGTLAPLFITALAFGRRRRGA